MPDNRADQILKLKRSIASLEEQQQTLGLDHADTLALLREHLAQLELAAPSIATQSGGVDVTAAQLTARDVTGRDKIESNTQTVTATDSAVATEGSAAANDQGVANTGTIGGHVIIAETGATVVVGEVPVTMTAVDRESVLGHYLQQVISRNRYLQLQGIRSGGKLVSIELDQIYITLRATRERTLSLENEWLKAEATLAPGELARSREPHHVTTETVSVNVNEALDAHARLVVLGDPGSGKTTLLRYLALLYARDIAEHMTRVRDKLRLNESGRLPILLPLRQIGAFLRARPEEGTDGHVLLLDFLQKTLANERIEVPLDFFDDYLQQGRAVILLDGMDEVADPNLRRRVSRLVESFTAAYPDCRYVVTSRVVGYTGSARLSEGYATTTVRDFTLADIELFLTHWHRLIAVGQMGPGDSAEAYAADQTQQLLGAVKSNDRVRELAINPLMLTVIAMVHRDRVKLPDRRAELYAEALDVLLGKWDEARGVQEVPILEDKPFDTGDRRLMLQNIALRMHDAEIKEVDSAELRRWLGEMFFEILRDWRSVAHTVDRFLSVIEERTGILAARGEGVYAFSHLTFQEYLAALAVAARDDYLEYTLKRAADPSGWWREVILLEAGYISTLSKDKVTRLIRALIDLRGTPTPFHNLVLAAECVRDVGSNRLHGDFESEIQSRLHQELDAPPPGGRLGAVQVFLQKGLSVAALNQRRIAATEALARVGGKVYWSMPFGEPDWVMIPAGEFMIGSEEYTYEKPQHRVHLGDFLISRVPITNAQYHLFVQATQRTAPEGWEEGRPPKGKESHPVVNVSWYHALAYCDWLSEVTGKYVTLPSEAEWEKVARGDKDAREYPWGDTFAATRCNNRDLGLRDTTPVGIFLSGASPYGVLDLSGNVWEWTRSLYGTIDKAEREITARLFYPYDPHDGRENLDADHTYLRVLRGGAFSSDKWDVRCAYRHWYDPDRWRHLFGFRCVVSAGSSQG